MHIVAIGWLYVTLMMAITEKSVTAGVLTFVFYGLGPCALLVWLGGSRSRHRSAKRQVMAADAESSVPDKKTDHPDRTDARPDQ